MNPNGQNYWQDQDDEAAQPPVESSPPSIDTAQPVANVQSIANPTPTDNDPINWTAQEYVHIDKGVGWYVLFGLVVLGFIALDIFLFKSYTFSLLVVVMAVALIVYTRRPPRVLTYTLSPTQGLYVGERQYHFDDFKAFGLIRDDEHYSIMLIPRKRFAPGVSVYFPEGSGEQIVDVLGKRLPMENLKLDMIDVLVRKLRL